MKTQKVWFITGASKGIGFEIAKAALNAGQKVAATVRSKAEELKDALLNNEQLEVITLDVTNEAAVFAGIQKAVERFGRIDIVVNNAGFGLLAATEEASDTEVRKQYDTNVFGMLNVIRNVLPQLRRQGSGHIINISSLFGYMASIPGFGIYSSTKFAVEGISEGLALEVNPIGINVTAAAPGLFRTNFAAADSYQLSNLKLDAYENSVSRIRQNMSHIDGSQAGDPEKLAQVILKLADSENPPLHLPIGSDAVNLFRTKVAKMNEELVEWAEVSGSTDHETTAIVK
jgi:NAD(P)-dependent dehydrogenase (short-subunit alcohol dehydrogenase family)